MPLTTQRHRLLAGGLSLALHAVVVALLVGGMPPRFDKSDEKPEAKETVTFLEVIPVPVHEMAPQPPVPVSPPIPIPAPDLAIKMPVEEVVSPLEHVKPTKPLASMEAPPPPTAEEWAFAARYTNKNSKGYRYSWGQQVRSMMGTAIEGLDQGVVRFRVEIGPDGKLVKLDTLWTTSKVAEQLARQAIESLPPLPPTPTGRPLVFEKTISFTPYASDGPPLYKDDCLPDPPSYHNPFAWDGVSPQVRAERVRPAPLSPEEMAECMRQLPKDTIEAEMANDQRLLDQWRSQKLGR